MENNLINIRQKYLIAGLGNPGREYKNNRHNVGFMFADHLARRLGIAFNQLKSKALITTTDYQGHFLVLAKPQTFMNLSGHPLVALLHYYKIPLVHFLVAYDDIDLPFGNLRMRSEGGSGGHNGMNSIIEKIGRLDFPRLRIGINRPPGKMDPASYVLQDFSKLEVEALPGILEKAVDAALYFVNNGIEAAMNQYNSFSIHPETMKEE
jgi:PTH1 family peptidyl-tRNA hydrolase